MGYQKLVTCSLTNRSNQALTLVRSHLKHGVWSERLQEKRPPPNTIDPGKTVWWGSESNGLFIGTEGTATYRSDDGTTFDLRWQNPFCGTNEASIHPESAAKLRAHPSITQGSDAMADFEIDDAAASETSTEPTQGPRPQNAPKEGQQAPGKAVILVDQYDIIVALVDATLRGIDPDTKQGIASGIDALMAATSDFREKNSITTGHPKKQALFTHAVVWSAEARITGADLHPFDIVVYFVQGIDRTMAVKRRGPLASATGLANINGWTFPGNKGVVSEIYTFDRNGVDASMLAICAFHEVMHQKLQTGPMALTPPRFSMNVHALNAGTKDDTMGISNIPTHTAAKYTDREKLVMAPHVFDVVPVDMADI